MRTHRSQTCFQAFADGRLIQTEACSCGRTMYRISESSVLMQVIRRDIVKVQSSVDAIVRGSSGFCVSGEISSVISAYFVDVIIVKLDLLNFGMLIKSCFSLQVLRSLLVNYFICKANWTSWLEK